VPSTAPDGDGRRLRADGLEADGQQLGLQGLAIPEEYGGSGFGWVELLIVFEEMGAALLCAPFLSSTIAAVTVLATDDNPAKASILPRIANGEALATLAYAEDADRHEDEHIHVVATGADSNWTLTGRKTLVLDGGIADILLVVARTPAGLSLFSVDGGPRACRARGWRGWTHATVGSDRLDATLAACSATREQQPRFWPPPAARPRSRWPRNRSGARSAACR